MSKGHYLNHLCLGVAGNVAGHISGAEKVQEKAIKPSGIFCFYAPSLNGFRGIYPLDDGTQIFFPKIGENIQCEPELVLECDISYKNKRISSLKVNRVTVGNDFSIRKLAGATKLAERKNWGEKSKGIAPFFWDVSSFDKETYGENYHLLSYVYRDQQWHPYSEPVSWGDYKIFYEPLLEWLTDTLNTQKEEGLFCDIASSILPASGYPKKALIFVGAPKYTPWGEKNPISPKDTILIAATVGNQRESIKKLEDHLKNLSSAPSSPLLQSWQNPWGIFFVQHVL